MSGQVFMQGPMQVPVTDRVYVAPPQDGLPVWVKIAAAVLVICVLVNMARPDLFITASTPVTGVLGGVTPAGTPSGQTGLAIGANLIQIATGPPVNANLVSQIVFTKNSAGASQPAGENGDWRTFQIGEVKVYDAANRLLTAGDFSRAEYNTPAYDNNSYPASNAYDGDPGSFIHTGGQDAIHQMTLTLKDPINISHVQVLNRADCCQRRLAGTVCELKRADGSVVASFTLTPDQIQDLTVHA
jgi:hypothetical protein